jgi:tetratricopeptide (TPR) repeat protein
MIGLARVPRLLPLLALASLAPALAGPAASLQDDDELEAVLAEERAEADGLRRRGRYGAALALLDQHVEEEPGDAASRLLRARVRLDQAEYEAALAEAQRALADARAGRASGVEAAAARTLARIHLARGDYDEALAVLEPAAGGEAFLAPADDPRDAWALGSVHLARGEREAALTVFRVGAKAPAVDWTTLLARGYCQWGAERLLDASRSFVAADGAAQEAGGGEADVLVALADLYFESEREVDVPGKRSAGALYREALERHPTHEGALVGLFELHRYNRRRQSRSPEEILADLLSVSPDSIEGNLVAASADLADGQLRALRERLARLDALAPRRREVRALHAALAWVEHRRDDCEAILAELLRSAPGDARPEGIVGRHLLELYRFAEAVPFLRRAVERDPTAFEAWNDLGFALANTGDEAAARDALANATRAARGRQDAKRKNLEMVLERMAQKHVVERHGELTFSWQPDAAEVLRTYFVPFYAQAREELAERYGFTPGQTTIEIFRRHQDFSVRSVGFEGFPALGVCFGPVVTALSPLSELRGTFSWSRTGFHEFSHVVHLGLSHNRCPRWITEGLATWEEVHRNPSWTRNMRRELIDARANGELIPVRELNRAFRGPRILFGYYQGGLLCTMLIEQHGFPAMVRLLEAFDAGLDLDQACEEVFATTPEALDAAFEEYVDRLVEGLAIEPRWSPRRVRRLALTLGREVPDAPEERAEWSEGWATVAWGHYQHGQLLDAQQALLKVDAAGVPNARAQFLRGEMALRRRDTAEAQRLWRAALAAGGRDYRALVGLGSLLEAEGELDEAEEFLLLAESVFPGYDQQDFSAELKLAALHERQERTDDAMAARERWLAWNAGEYDLRVEVSAWHRAAGRRAEEARLLDEAAQVDLFRRDLHRAWADALAAEERWAEALREYGVALLVPAELDPDHWIYVGPPDELPPGMTPENMTAAQKRAFPPEAFRHDGPDAEERAELMAQEARCLEALGRHEEAAARAGEALKLDPNNEAARDRLR